MRLGSCLLLVAMAMAMATGEATAQFRGGMPGGAMRGSRDGQMGRDQRPPGEQRPAVQEDPVGLAEYRLDLLRTDLKLAPEQEALWTVYADKVSALAADVSRERARLQATLQMKSLPRIDHSVDVARNRLTALEDIASAAKAFYARLTPAQQSIADERLATVLPTSPGPGFTGAAGGRPRPPQ